MDHACQQERLSTFGAGGFANRIGQSGKDHVPCQCRMMSRSENRDIAFKVASNHCDVAFAERNMKRWKVKLWDLRTLRNLSNCYGLLVTSLWTNCTWGLHTSSNVAASVDAGELREDELCIISSWAKLSKLSTHHTLDCWRRWEMVRPHMQLLQSAPVCSSLLRSPFQIYFPRRQLQVWLSCRRIPRGVTHGLFVSRKIRAKVNKLELPLCLWKLDFCRLYHETFTQEACPCLENFDRCIHRVGWTRGLHIKPKEQLTTISLHWNQNEISFCWSKHECKLAVKQAAWLCTPQQFPGPLVCWPNCGWLPLRLKLTCSIGSHL